MSHNSSPCFLVLQIGDGQASFPDIVPHSFGTHLPWPLAPSCKGSILFASRLYDNLSYLVYNDFCSYTCGYLLRNFPWYRDIVLICLIVTFLRVHFHLYPCTPPCLDIIRTLSIQDLLCSLLCSCYSAFTEYVVWNTRSSGGPSVWYLSVSCPLEAQFTLPFIFGSWVFSDNQMYTQTDRLLSVLHPRSTLSRAFCSFSLLLTNDQLGLHLYDYSMLRQFVVNTQISQLTS